MAASPFALYVHIPFCTAKCTYCDFNSYAGQESLMPVYADALVAEAGLWAPRLAGRRAETVFFGGGTPSLMPVDLMGRIVTALHDRFDLADEAEISLEANPGTVDAPHLAGLRRVGFNRVSFGVQSFHDDELRRLDRVHDARAVEDAVHWARQAGFANLNLDLIYGLAEQTLAGWQANVEAALALAPDHLSLYALTLEEGTPLTRDVGRGRSTGPDLDLQADMFEWSRERLRRAGFAHYEISNWARPGRECRHNLVYWRNGDWLGLGAGAHSHLDGERLATAASPSRYVALVKEGAGLDLTDGPLSHPSEGSYVPQAHPERLQSIGPASMPQISLREPADPAREMSETVILALRLREGLDLAAFERRFGLPLEAAFAAPLHETLALGLTELVPAPPPLDEHQLPPPLEGIARPDNARGESARGASLRLRDEAVMLGDEAFLRFLPAEA